jgi:hypothetical protein
MPSIRPGAWLRLSLAFVVLVLTGCASAPPYEDAMGPDTAKLRLKMEEPFAVNMYMAAFDPQACKIQTAFSWITGGVEAIYRKRVPMLGSSPPGEGRLEFIVPAGRPLAAYPVMSFARNVDPALFSQHDFLQKALDEMDAGPCRAPAFVPQAGREYEISIRTMPGMCRTRIYQLSQGDLGIVRQDITRKLGLEVVRDSNQKPVCRAMRDDAMNR